MGTSVGIKEMAVYSPEHQRNKMQEISSAEPPQRRMSLGLFGVSASYHLPHSLQLFFQGPCSHECYAFTSVSIFSWTHLLLLL